MSGFEVVEVAHGDDAGIRAWAAVTAASLRHDVGPPATPWTAEELAVVVGTSDGMRRDTFHLGLLDGEPVAAGWLAMRLLDNLDAAELDVHVLPAHRRHGYGGRVLDRLHERAAEACRSRLDARSQWPYDGPADGAGTPGMAFALARGYHFGIGEVQRELVLPVSEERLVALAEAAAPHHAAYRIEAWQGPVPDELVESWLAVWSTLPTEAPTGESEREDDSADVAAFRAMEATQARQGRRSWHAVALDAAGEVVAYTEVVVPAHDPGVAFQWGTLVARGHRGHRLGVALKVANLQALQRDLGPAVSGRRLVTWNAEVNGPMIDINEELGFVPSARSAELQRRAG
ncbi:GNAT family N-acetyltransferase [Pimelobacter simplex]|uniref:GNAT family N-acetyltransferase n=1 Tax=Nocardioides simplex TaxID=2045 RepID=UPI0021502E69|nr:GNAT family N-acetyltransferase [Pimelobacter simplex]UUW92168.1 GNAT family N-acetyltransferase [Pimelobacter simplex]UUW95994.1 GNAT family N-acetyltransferase [Pimelobacter simplex]